MKFKKISSFITVLALLITLGIVSYAEEPCATVNSNGTSVSYSSFSEAWSKAVDLGNSGEVTLVLNKDWQADSTGSLGSGSGFNNGALSYSGGNNLTIDLNGYSIDRNLFKPISGGAVIYVNSTVTITDSRSGEYTVSDLFRGGAIKNGSNTERGGGIVIADNATLNLYGGTVLNCVSTDDGGAISITGSGARLNIDGGSFYGNRTYDSSGECCGGAIYSNAATIKINNAVFEGNYAEDNGGAIYANDGSVYINSSRFYSNSSIEEGGAVYADGSVNTEFRNCLLSQNTSSDDDGGAVYCDSSNGTYFYDCQMYYNHAASEGGAVFINADKVFFIGGCVQYNTASKYGGGIYVDSMYDMNASGKLIIKDNTVNGKASDVCLQDGTASTAYLYCGGLYEGSSVWLCSNETGSQLAIKGIDKYQYTNYIHFDEGFTAGKINSSSVSSDNIRAIASAFGKGNVLYICIALLIILISATVTASVRRKKKGANKNDR